ncbi:hypothetical protein, partial [Rodentibacter genomosp. 1]|uniref:hypothetical protein n=1 Tax=Rodentibacter genomosp. 1 TaxID=1908264 RepID=UPI001ABF23F6
LDFALGVLVYLWTSNATEEIGKLFYFLTFQKSIIQTIKKSGQYFQCFYGLGYLSLKKPLRIDRTF